MTRELGLFAQPLGMMSGETGWLAVLGKTHGGA